MKIKILSNRALQTLKYNISADLSFYEKDTAKDLLNSLGKDSLIDTGLEIPSLNLVISANSTDDFENVKKVYSALKNVISPSQATDERLWAGMSMDDDCWRYINTRWKEEKWTKNGIKDHIYFNHSGRRSLTRQALSRLWWIGYLTYDDSNKEDPWIYTKNICSNQRFIVDVLERNMSNNIDLIRACVDSCIKYSTNHEDKKIDSNQMREIQKGMSILGGTYLLDALDPDELREKIYRLICDIVQ